jgi:hypothetical protein
MLLYVTLNFSYNAQDHVNSDHSTDVFIVFRNKFPIEKRMVRRVLLPLNICTVDVGLCNKKSIVCRLLCNVLYCRQQFFTASTEDFDISLY